MLQRETVTVTVYRGQDPDAPLGHWWSTDEGCAGEFGDVIEREVDMRIVRVSHTAGLAPLDAGDHDRLVALLDRICEMHGADAVLLPEWDYGQDCFWIAQSQLTWMY